MLRVALCALLAAVAAAHSLPGRMIAFTMPPSVPTPFLFQGSPTLRPSRMLDVSTTRSNLFGWGEKKEDKQDEQPAQKKMSGPCSRCSDAKAVDCPTCAGTGKDKKNGNVLERWKCMECQGFGFVSCPVCSGGKGAGLTPEQTGER